MQWLADLAQFFNGILPQSLFFGALSGVVPLVMTAYYAAQKSKVVRRSQQHKNEFLNSPEVRAAEIAKTNVAQVRTYAQVIEGNRYGREQQVKGLMAGAGYTAQVYQTSNKQLRRHKAKFFRETRMVSSAILEWRRAQAEAQAAGATKKGAPGRRNATKRRRGRGQ